MAVLSSTAVSRHVTATVEEVLPSTGLAYLTDAAQGSWTVTRSTRGDGLAGLRPGQQLDLTVVEHDGFALVSAYATLD